MKIKNNLAFLLIHIILSCIFWYMTIRIGDKYIRENYYTFFAISIIYIAMAFLISGKIIRIGDTKSNLFSVWLIPFIFFFIWLTCRILDDGSMLSGLVWVIFIYPLGSFSAFCTMKMFEEKSIILFLFSFIPSLLFWLGMEIKSLYLRKIMNSNNLN